MVLKRFLGLAAAAVTALSCGITAFADDGEEEAIKFKILDKDKVVSAADKVGYTFSFDKDDWKDYIKLTPDAEKAGLKIASSDKSAYQGKTLKVSVNAKSAVSDKQYFGWALNNEDTTADTEGLITMGFEIDAEDLGITTFDGSLVIFTYRFDSEGVNSLLGNSIAAYTAKDNYKDSGGYSIITKNETLSDNITKYQDAMINVPTSGNATKIIIEIPVTKAYSGEIISIDNLDITLPGDNGSIKNLDGYNVNAEAKQYDPALEIKGKKNNDTGITPTQQDNSKDKGLSRLVVIIIAVVAVLLVCGGAFIFVRMKKKFY